MVAHWATPQGKLESRTIAFHRFWGAHTGANIASALFNVLVKYDMCGKVGHITTDNATNNDSAMVELGILLSEKGISFDPEASRVRCFGHIINWVVNGFLWGSDWEAFESGMNRESSSKEEAKSLKAWRKKGPMGKLHNIGVWILRTPQRRDRFSEKVQLTRGPK